MKNKRKRGTSKDVHFSKISAKCNFICHFFSGQDHLDRLRAANLVDVKSMRVRQLYVDQNGELQNEIVAVSFYNN